MIPLCDVIIGVVCFQDMALSPLYWRSDTVSNPSGLARFDILTGPVAAARAVATGAWVKTKHGMYLIRGSVGA